MKTAAPKIPAIAAGSTGDVLVAAINDRLRRLETFAVQASSAGAAPAAASKASGPTELVLAVPGTLGIMSSAAPLVSLAADATPSEIVALVKTAPLGAALTLKVLAGSTPVGIVVIGAGAVTASVSGGAKIPAEAVITLGITTVGTTFPGADLTVMVRF